MADNLKDPQFNDKVFPAELFEISKRRRKVLDQELPKVLFKKPQQAEESLFEREKRLSEEEDYLYSYKGITSFISARKKLKLAEDEAKTCQSNFGRRNRH